MTPEQIKECRKTLQEFLLWDKQMENSITGEEIPPYKGCKELKQALSLALTALKETWSKAEIETIIKSALESREEK